MGPAIIVIVLLLIPVAVMMTGALVAAILGFFLKKDVDARFEGTEYLDIS